MRLVKEWDCDDAIEIKLDLSKEGVKELEEIILQSLVT